MKNTSIDLKSLIFLGLMILVALVTFNLFSRYITLIIVTLVIVQIFHPIFRFLKKKLRSSGVSTFLSILLVLIFLIVPVTILIVLIVSEIQNIANSTSLVSNISNLEGIINDFIIRINQVLSGNGINLSISQINLGQVLSELDKTAFVRDQLLPFVSSVASLSGEILFTLFLMLLSLIYLFPAYDKLPMALSRISPLDNDTDLLIFQRFRDTIKGVVKGTFVVAILQATAVIIPFIILQIGAPILLWVIMVILSVIPIGSGLVWGPVGLAIIVNGIAQSNPATIIIGIAVIIYSAVIINVIDTTVRPRLMKNAVNLHPLITIFSVLGGIGIFGFIGILYGPLIVVLFLTVMEVYRKKYLNKDEEA